MTSREKKARALRDRGLTLAEIGSEFGCSVSSVRRLLDPRIAERSRRQSLAAKKRRTGTCVDCGATTGYAGHGQNGGVSERCQPCGAIYNGQIRTVWTDERIIQAIREWAAEYGEPPAHPDWDPWTCIHVLNDPHRALRFQNDDRWPWFNTVVTAFGTFNKGIEAAGFVPRASGGSITNVRRRRDLKAKAAA